MRDPARIDEVLAALRTYWVRNPDLRLGQAIASLAGHEPFMIEDDQFLARLREENSKPNAFISPSASSDADHRATLRRLLEEFAP